MIGIEWDKKFELGHERIDFEHRIFLDLIRSVSKLSATDADPKRLSRTLSEVLKYAEFHFLSEENLMEDIHYPEIEEHRYEHRMLLAQIAEIINGSRRQQNNLDDIVDFLFRWFALHTTQVDKRLIHYIEEQGAAT
jgi:hemerythrin